MDVRFSWHASKVLEFRPFNEIDVKLSDMIENHFKVPVLKLTAFFMTVIQIMHVK